MSKATYLSAFKEWLECGRPGGRPPLSTDHDVSLCDVYMKAAEIEAADRIESTGLSHWKFYDPSFYEAFMEARRRQAR